MEQTLNTMNSQVICEVCHQPILPTYYFCPNCGVKLKSAPLSVKIADQIKLYLFSIVLPFLGFLLAGKWEGFKYLRSKDEKTKNIGIIACILIAISTIALIWFTVVGTQAMIKSTTDSINADMGF